jgi:hypothetical protein
MSDKLKAMATKGLKPSKAYPIDVVSWLLRKKAAVEFINSLPCSDHLSFWTDEETGARIVLSQPYGPLSHKDLAEALEVAERNSLSFTVSGASWHYPGWTVLLIWKGQP